MRTLKDAFFECIAKAKELGLDNYVLLVQSYGRYLAVVVDEVLEDGFKSEGVYYPYHFNFCAVNETTASQILKSKDRGKSIQITEEKTKQSIN